MSEINHRKIRKKQNNAKRRAKLKKSRDNAFTSEGASGRNKKHMSHGGGGYISRSK